MDILLPDIAHLSRLKTRSWLRVGCFLSCVLASAVLAGCRHSTDSGNAAASGNSARLAVSNSYLEAAALDVLDGREQVVRLAEPGICPGHFDVRPSQVNDLRRCRVLLRFDFQRSLDAKLSHLADDGFKIGEVRISGGLCEPSSYLAACRQVADALVANQLADRAVLNERLAVVEKRVLAKSDWCRGLVAMAGWSGRPVVCSVHQKAFCEWLSLKVAATFSGADTASVGEIEEAIRAGNAASVSAIIANLPEGRRVADALGQRLNARVVVFGNFPAMQGDEPPFDALLTTNVTALGKAPGIERASD